MSEDIYMMWVVSPWEESMSPALYWLGLCGSLIVLAMNLPVLAQGSEEAVMSEYHKIGVNRNPNIFECPNIEGTNI